MHQQARTATQKNALIATQAQENNHHSTFLPAMDGRLCGDRRQMKTEQSGMTRIWATGRGLARDQFPLMFFE